MQPGPSKASLLPSQVQTRLDTRIVLVHWEKSPCLTLELEPHKHKRETWQSNHFDYHPNEEETRGHVQILVKPPNHKQNKETSLFMPSCQFNKVTSRENQLNSGKKDSSSQSQGGLMLPLTIFAFCILTPSHLLFPCSLLYVACTLKPDPNEPPPPLMDCVIGRALPCSRSAWSRE
jgi:hypothetical protein